MKRHLMSHRRDPPELHQEVVSGRHGHEPIFKKMHELYIVRTILHCMLDLD